MKQIVVKTLRLIGRGQRRRWAALVVLALIAGFFEMLGALLVYVLLALVVDPGGALELPVFGEVSAAALGQDQLTVLVALVVAMAVFFLMRAGIQTGVTYAQQRVAHNAGARLSNRLVEGYLRAPYEMHLQRSSAELIRNGHQAVRDSVTHVFLPLIRVVAETILTAGMIVVLVVIAPAAAGLAVVVVGGSAALLLLFVQPRMRRFGATAHDMSRATLGAVQEALQGVREIKVLGRSRFFARRYGRDRAELARATYLASTFKELPRIVIETALVLFILIFFLVALLLGGGAQEALSVLGLFAYAGLRLQPSLQRIILGMQELKYSSAPLDDIAADLNLVETFSEDVDAEPFPFEVQIEMQGVGFRYEGVSQVALDEVNLVIGAGEQIGVCGPTGGGKSTLVDLLAGVIEPTFGRIIVDGQDVRQYSRAWQNNLGLVPQNTFLIDDTLARNIALGVPDDQIDRGGLDRAVEQAQLQEFVDRLPEGLGTRVGERGVRISGGQRQRIAIARALYRDPAVLIFDEATSALDSETENALMASIEKLRGNRTLILIAHRLSTVRNCDRVVVIEHGKVTGVAGFDHLRRTNPRFAAMLASQ